MRFLTRFRKGLWPLFNLRDLAVMVPATFFALGVLDYVYQYVGLVALLALADVTHDWRNHRGNQQRSGSARIQN